MSKDLMPGVFIQESNPRFAGVVDVPSAVPAFIGYTERAERAGRSLRNTPCRIESLADYHALFGRGPMDSVLKFVMDATPDAAPTGAASATVIQAAGLNGRLRQVAGFYLLYNSLRLYFLNGGGACWIVSVGHYSAEPGVHIEAAALAAGLSALEAESEPTLLVVPETVLLPDHEGHALQAQMLKHCGERLPHRFAILDLARGDQPRENAPDPVDAFREGVGVLHLSHGAAYYPWLHTTVVQAGELGWQHVESGPGVAVVPDPAEASPMWAPVRAAMVQQLNLLPPGAAMAGLYGGVDQTRGVWRAPANIALASVQAPCVAITDRQQDDLNVPASGKAVNALRSFPDQGVLVWGARTLDGNSHDWRYINVRRTVTVIEASIQLALRAFEFEPNTTATWSIVRIIISQYLEGIWRRGGLMGAAAEDAFSVRVGMGETMVPQDILHGCLRVELMLCLIRPGEFIVITLELQMASA